MTHDAVINMNEKRNPDIIYQCYQPINVTELREYMLYCISKDIEASAKCRLEDQDDLSKADEEPLPDDGDESPTTAKKLSLDEKIMRLKTNLFAP